MTKYTGWEPTYLHPETGKRIETGILTPDSTTDNTTLAAGQRVHGSTGLLLLVIPILLIGIIVGYQTGMLETLGYESKSIQGGGFTSTASGYSLGLKTMYFRQGQTVFAEYEATVAAGALGIRMYNYDTMLGADSYFRHRIESTGPGEVEFVVKESGWHHLVFEGSVLGQNPSETGYQVDYTITWGMR